MAEFLNVTVRVPIRKDYQDQPNDFFDGTVRIVPSSLSESHYLLLDGEFLVDSLAEVTNVQVAEE